MAQQALFAGLVYDEMGTLVETKTVGGEAFYIVDDNGFHRHIDADYIDRQVLNVFFEQLQQHKDLAVDQALRLMGRDDLMTKAAVDATLNNLDMDQIIEQGIPLQARNMLGMMGFKIAVNVHGDLVDIQQPQIGTDEE